MSLRDPADGRAWAEFVDIYGPLVRRLARRRGLQHADVEDLVQEVFRVVSAALERGAYDPARGSFRGRLFRIARNLAVNALVERRRHLEGTGDTAVGRLLENQPAPAEADAAQFAAEYRRRMLEWAAERVLGDEVWSLGFSPDGATLAAGLKSGPVALVEVATGAERRRLAAHTLGVGGVAYTPDGSRLISGGWDRTLRVWDPCTGAVLATLKGPDGAVTSVAVSPDGRTAASGDGDANDANVPGALLVWNLDAPGLRARIPGHAGRIWSVGFSPDGKTLATGGEDGAVKLWDLAGWGPARP
jgi:RNA polymerase sigma-70 factor (ECF subfamily)